MNALSEKIKSSDYGILYQFPEDKKTKYISSKDNIQLLKVNRVILNGASDRIAFKLKIFNDSKKRLRLNSAIISEFEWDLNPKEIIKTLINGWVQSSDSGYIEGIKQTKKTKLFLLRDQNPYSFKGEFGYIENSCISEWYTQLVLKDFALFIGAITVDKQFCQIFISKQEEHIKIRVTAQLDGITLAPKETIETEEILFLIGDEKVNLSRFADIMKSKLQDEILLKPIKGICCSYYAQGNKVDFKYVQGTVDKLNEIVLTENKKNTVVQIDAGYCKFGDWLSTNKEFGATLKETAEYIKENGYMPGIWISPFIAEKDSDLFREHNDWFIKKKGKPFESRQTSPLDFLPLLSMYVLDVTKEEVQEYIKEVVKKFKGYGYSFIKIDFLYPSCFADVYSKNVTRAQAIRMGVQAIREAAGRETYIMSAISHLSPLVGLVNYARTGLDTSNPFVYGIPIVGSRVNDVMLRKNLNNYKNRLFYDKKIWINDIDCLVVNPKSYLSDTLLKEHYDFITQSQAKWIGDDIRKLNSKLIDKYIKPILNE